MTEPSYQYGSSDVHEHADVRFIDLYMLVSTEKLALYSCLGRQMTQLHDVLQYLPVYFDHNRFLLTPEAVGDTAI